jgi:tetratricopeptide (TPR) repeat protein
MALDQDPEASLQLRQAIEDDPQSADGYLGLALLYQRNQAWHLQAKAAEMASQLEPRNGDAWILRGQAASAQGDHGAAADYFARAQQAARSDPRPAALESGERTALGDFKRAASLARKAVTLGPKQAGGYAALGAALSRLGRDRLPEAEEAYSTAASLGDDSGQANLGLGRVLLRQRKVVEAEQQFRLAVRRNPAVSDAHYGLAQALTAQGKDAEAREAERQFRRWVKFDEESARLHDQVALHAEDARAWFKLARLYADRELWQPARRMTLSGLRRAPADAEGQKLLEMIDARR